MRSRRPDRNSFVKTARSILSNDRGFSLMEMMITVAVLGIVALGTTVLFSDMFNVQKRGETVAMIQVMRAEIIDAVSKSDTIPFDAGNPTGPRSAWDRMVRDNTAATGNPFLACVNNNTVCAKDTAVRLNVIRADNTELFNSRTATRGFRLNGQLCNTFSIATPDPTCPFSWTILVRARCVGTTSDATAKVGCENPVIEVDGELQFSPGSNSPLNGPINTAAYAFNVRRGDKPEINQPIVLSYVRNNNVGEAGTCTPVGTVWGRRLLNTLVDPSSNASLTSANTFSLRSGGYDCRIQSPAFKNGNNRIRLARVAGGATTPMFTSGPATASLSGGSATVTLQATFVLNAATELTIEHWCSGSPMTAPSPSPNNDYILGVPARGTNAAGVVGYEGVTYTVVSCVKTS